MIKEIIIVEGKQDIAAVRRAVDAECIATGGFTLAPHTVRQIEHAYHKRGIVILTDPDSAGERIRRFLAQRFPQAKHAFVPREAAYANADVGIEQASPAAICSALSKVRTQQMEPGTEFSWQDVIKAGLSGTRDASAKRAILGEQLGIGYANAKGFLARLNNYGVTREEFSLAVAGLEENA